MRAAGIIAEYNPFHNGHLYHIQKAKELTGADFLVVVMSGDFVQRGTPAIVNKHLRAKMALLCGADLVLELPVPYATASAESFAYGGVAILHHLGIVDHLCFGSEWGNTDAMMEIAKILLTEPDWYTNALKEHLKNGLSYPAARAAALPSYSEILSEPNNILGIEYCKAILKLNSKIKPLTIKRQGSGYHDTELDTAYPSASGIRKLLSHGELSADPTIHLTENHPLRNCMPEPALHLLLEEYQKNGFVTENDFSQILFYKLLQLSSPEDLFSYSDLSEELANRIFKQRFEFKSFSQFADLLKTKEITRTRIQRALLHILLEIKKDAPDGIYGRILGFRKSSSQLLTQIKKQGTLPLISKTSAAESQLEPSAYTAFQKDIEASNQYEMILAQRKQRDFLHEHQKQLVLVP